MRDVHSSEALFLRRREQLRQGFDADAELRKINQLIGTGEAQRARFAFVQMRRARSLDACADQTDLHCVARLIFHRSNYDSPNNRSAFSFRISGRTSSRMAIFSKSASQRSGAIN